MQAQFERSVPSRWILRFALLAPVFASGCAVDTQVPDTEASIASEGVFTSVEGSASSARLVHVDSEAKLEALTGQDGTGLVSKGVIECGPRIALRSKANNLFVAAEFGWGGDDWGMLRARAPWIGPWEEFRFCSDGAPGTLIINEIEWKFVSAELGWGGDRWSMLRARAVNPGPWERFGIWPAGHIAISSDAARRWVSAELGWGGDRNGMLRGRATDLGPWELFEVWCLEPGRC